MTRCCEVVQNGARTASPETAVLRLRPRPRDIYVPQAVGKLGMSIGALHLNDGFLCHILFLILSLALIEVGFIKTQSNN